MGWVLFFDGDCAFCSASVRRAVKFDRRKVLRFSPLQGKLAEKMGFAGNAAGKGGTMVLLRERDGKVFFRSEAAIELARALGGMWRWLVPLKFVPRVIRDGVYQWIADHRHVISKKGDFCSLPDPEVAGRLID